MSVPFSNKSAGLLTINDLLLQCTHRIKWDDKF